MIPWKLSRTIAVIAHPIAIASAAVTTTLLSRDKREHAVRFGVALPLAVGLTKGVKRLFPRHKPRILTLTPNESMPSGHSAATAACTLALVDARRAWRWAPLAIAATALVNASRVRDREHRVTEVLTGDAIGLAGAVTAGVVARWIARRLERRAATAVEQQQPVAAVHGGEALRAAASPARD